jgi:hypothetical protein
MNEISSNTADLADRASTTIVEGLKAAERHLGLSSGTITSMVHDPDYLFLIKAIAVLEPVVNDLINSAFSRPHGGLGGQANADRFSDTAEFLTERLQLNGRAGKVELAKSLGVLTDDEGHFITAIAQMRNRYAHNIRSTEKPISEIYDECRRGNGKFLSHLTFGRVTEFKVNDNGQGIKLFILYGFSSFLDTKIKQMKWDKIGLLGILQSIKGEGR